MWLSGMQAGWVSGMVLASGSAMVWWQPVPGSAPIPPAGEGVVVTTQVLPAEPVVVVDEAKLLEGPITDADRLLARLEQADKGLKSLSAKILYDKYFDLDESRQTRLGRLGFVVEAKPAPVVDGAQPVAATGTEPKTVKKFGVHVTKLRLGQTWRDENQYIIFDGQYLVEKSVERKQFVKRKLVADGATVDPLRVGEGPFPLPIGQKRADILKRFNAELLPAGADLVGIVEEETEGLVKFVEGCYQLKLTVREELRAGMDASEPVEIRLWYKEAETADSTGKKPLLPRLVRTKTTRDDISMVQMKDVELNGAIDPELVSTVAPAGGFDVKEEDMTRAAEPVKVVPPTEPPAGGSAGNPAGTPGTTPR